MYGGPTAAESWRAYTTAGSSFESLTSCNYYYGLDYRHYYTDARLSQEIGNVSDSGEDWFASWNGGSTSLGRTGPGIDSACIYEITLIGETKS